MQKFYAVLFAIFLIFLFNPPAYAAVQKALLCDIEEHECPNGFPITVFKMQDESNAHAGTNTSAYDNYVCCKGLGGYSISLSMWDNSNKDNCDQGKVISLARDTNSHVSKYGLSSYDYNICLSSSPGNLSCTYRNACLAKEECLGSLSADVNAHIGECDEYSARKICCGLSSESPQTAWEESDLTIRTGEEGTLMIEITNPLDVPDVYTLEMYATPSKLGYWSWFNGHRYDEQKMNTSIRVDPQKTVNVAIIIFGGTSLNGDIYIKMKSSVQGRATELSKKISITYGPEGLFARTPEFGWLGYALIGIFAALLI